MRENRLWRVRMRGSRLVTPATGGTDDERHFKFSVEHITDLRGVVDDRIQRQESEIDGHHFGDWAQAIHRGANGRAGNRHLADRRIAHAALAEFLQETARDTVRALPFAHFLAHHEDALITPHLFQQSAAQGLAHGLVTLRHRRRYST